MKTVAAFLTSLIVAGWMSAIAIVSVQNFSPISLKFLGYESFQMPMGIVLAFSVCIGIVGTAIIQPVLGSSGYTADEDDEE